MHRRLLLVATSLTWIKLSASPVSLLEDARVALCGGIAGATGTALLYPFDTAKTLRQTKPEVHKSVYGALCSLYSQGLRQGTRLAYSGVLTSTLGAIPSSALYFGSYEFSKRRLEAIARHYFVEKKRTMKIVQSSPTAAVKDKRPLCDRKSAIGNGLQISNLKKQFVQQNRTGQLPARIRILTHALAAATGNSVSSLVFVPKEYIKQHLQTNGGRTNKHIHEVVWETVNTGGIKELYSGYKATLMRNVPSAILRFALYEEIKLRFVENDDVDVEIGASPRFFLAGMTAGACASAIMTPLDVIKTRLATHTIPKNVNTVLGTGRAILEENGINALYAGVGARMLWSGMFSAIGFGTFEMCKRNLHFPPRRQAAMASIATN
mmetsp:Transcript_27774/g.43086  ORF Transcript_27774/g.43086 Transcript_27774/m.43086 type:complete len:379 (-) Transcript_27774:30-1166(-)